MSLYPNDYLISAGASLLYTIFWAVFFYFYSPKRTIRFRYLLLALILGIGSAPLALAFEKTLLYILNPDIIFFATAVPITQIPDLLGPFVFSFLFVAILEESTKFFIIKKYFAITAVNQVIDGMKIGLGMGLGFAAVENFFYFFDIYNSGSDVTIIVSVFLLRGAISTLAHALYGIIMGYYLSLAKFHLTHRGHFLKSALLASVLAHGFFNFFLITNMGYFSVFMLAVFIVITLAWYNDRKNLELFINLRGQSLVVPPFLAEELEKQMFKESDTSRANYLDKLWRLLMKK